MPFWNKLWNTGVDETGTPLAVPTPTTKYIVDPHWKLVKGPGIINPQPVYVLAHQTVGGYFATADSRWVWANPTGMGDPSSAYVFQTEFLLETNLTHWIEITGKWGADNFGQFTINWAPLPPGASSGAVSLPAGPLPPNYTQAHTFSISQTHLVSLVPGLPPLLVGMPLSSGYHTLEVWVYNAGPEDATNPAGLNVSALSIAKHPR